MCHWRGAGRSGGEGMGEWERGKAGESRAVGEGMGEQGSSSSQQIFTAGVTEGTELWGFLWKH